MDVMAQKVITVHETGYAERGHVTDDEMHYIPCGEHFVKRPEPLRRNVVTSSLKTIDDFELPVYRFQRRRKKTWWFFGRDVWVYKKVDTARGSILGFLDGTSMFVKETESSVRQMIEG